MSMAACELSLRPAASRRFPGRHFCASTLLCPTADEERAGASVEERAVFEDDICEFLQFTERPVGTAENARANGFIAERAAALGLEVTRLPFDCPLWVRGGARIERADMSFEIHPGPYSPPYAGSAPMIAVQSLDALTAARCRDKILLLHGPIAAEPLMPRDFPFFFPDGHRAIYQALEAAQPAAIIAVTGQHPSYGLSPHALISDANFPIPSAYLDARTFDAIGRGDGDLRLRIDSRIERATAEQLVIRRPAATSPRSRIIVSAHMDTAHGTPGALDNGAGVAVLLAIMARLGNGAPDVEVEFLPFNGEDSCGAYGELAWLDHRKSGMGSIACAVNIDAVGHRGSRIAVSGLGLPKALAARLDRMIARDDALVVGAPWFEGDQSIFASLGIATLVLTSSDLNDAVLPLAHTPRDVRAEVDGASLGRAADFVTAWIQTF